MFLGLAALMRLPVAPFCSAEEYRQPMTFRLPLD